MSPWISCQSMFGELETLEARSGHRIGVTSHPDDLLPGVTGSGNREFRYALVHCHAVGERDGEGWPADQTILPEIEVWRRARPPN